MELIILLIVVIIAVFNYIFYKTSCQTNEVIIKHFDEIKDNISSLNRVTNSLNDAINSIHCEVNHISNKNINAAVEIDNIRNDVNKIHSYCNESAKLIVDTHVGIKKLLKAKSAPSRNKTTKSTTTKSKEQK